MNFADRLIDAIALKQAPVAVELAPRVRDLPIDLVPDGTTEEQISPQQVGSLLERFCGRLIERLAPLVPAVILPIDAFERYGQPGMDAFFNVAMRARKGGLLVIGHHGRPSVCALAGVLPFGRRSLLRHVWDVDAVFTGPLETREELAAFVRVAAETGKGVFVPARLAAGPDTAAPSGWSVVEAIDPAAVRLRGRYGYGPIGVVLGRGHDALACPIQARPAGSFLLIPSQLDAANDRRAYEEFVDPDGFGVVLTASRELTMCFRREPWSHRFAPEEWADAVQAAALDWIGSLQAAVPAVSSVLL